MSGKIMIKKDIRQKYGHETGELWTITAKILFTCIQSAFFGETFLKPITGKKYWVKGSRAGLGPSCWLAEGWDPNASLFA